jgi:hypothetical protein
MPLAGIVEDVGMNEFPVTAEVNVFDVSWLS